MKNLLLIIVTLLSLNGTSQLPTDTIGHDGVNVKLLDSLVEVYVNEERVSRSIKPLLITKERRVHSYNHSQWMVDNDKFEHSQYPSECILMKYVYVKATYIEIAKKMVKQWFDSPGHKRNLLDSRYEYGGCGTATITDLPVDSFYTIKSSFGLSIWERNL
jgi:uncharacterized protein YkwD